MKIVLTGNKTYVLVGIPKVFKQGEEVDVSDADATRLLTLENDAGVSVFSKVGDAAPAAKKTVVVGKKKAEVQEETPEPETPASDGTPL